MTAEDKTFLLGILQMPRLGLNQQQILGIERILDGVAPSPMLDVVAITYAQAAEVLGFTSKNSAKTIEKFVRNGRLVRSSPGRVTVASVQAFGKAVA